MALTEAGKKYPDTWNKGAWVWVCLWIGVIYASAPLARSIQKFVYAAAGREFFTYISLAALCAGIGASIYLFYFVLKIRRPVQYLWLLAGALTYSFLILQLKEHPEEALHLVEYGILSCLVFNALKYKVRDWTIYLSIVLIVLLCGTMDELIQWTLPTRYWDYRDVGVNLLGGGLCVIILWLGVKPSWITLPVKRSSVLLLQRLTLTGTIVIGLCLMNTPSAVQWYTSSVSPISWLQQEEPMTEYGHKHVSDDAVVLYSRLTLDQLTDSDRNMDPAEAAHIQSYLDADEDLHSLIKQYRHKADFFLYEFMLHLARRDGSLEHYLESGSKDEGREAAGENRILGKYFVTALNFTGQQWQRKVLHERDFPVSGEPYVSRTGKLITSFSLRTVWIVIPGMLFTFWRGFRLWRKNVSDG